MYAVIQTGGKQYRVQPGETIVVEKLLGSPGDEVKFDQVLLLSDDQTVAVGRPTVDGATVRGEIVRHQRGEKLVVYKFRHRKNYRRKNGHRQELTAVKINAVVTP
jgi:large subunit ribosomal protein L21